MKIELLVAAIVLIGGLALYHININLFPKLKKVVGWYPDLSYTHHKITPTMIATELLLISPEKVVGSAAVEVEITDTELLMSLDNFRDRVLRPSMAILEAGLPNDGATYLPNGNRVATARGTGKNIVIYKQLNDSIYVIFLDEAQTP